MSPALALGQAVHESLEALSQLPREQRFREPLPNRFERAWQKVTGKKGGFFSTEKELEYQKRGRDMIARVYNHPGPIAELSVKIQKDLPYFWLSEDDNIILCGKIDWLEYLPDTDSVHIIDFKTGKRREDPESLQLPIYYLLVSRCQKRDVTKASYWYLEDSDMLMEKALPARDKAEHDVLDIARRVKLARQLRKFDCPKEGECYHCATYEQILRDEGEFIGIDEYNYDVYVLPSGVTIEDDQESVIL